MLPRSGQWGWGSGELLRLANQRPGLCQAAAVLHIVCNEKQATRPCVCEGQGLSGTHMCSTFFYVKIECREASFPWIIASSKLNLGTCDVFRLHHHTHADTHACTRPHAHTEVIQQMDKSSCPGMVKSSGIWCGVVWSGLAWHDYNTTIMLGLNRVWVGFQSGQW